MKAAWIIKLLLSGLMIFYIELSCLSIVVRASDLSEQLMSESVNISDYESSEQENDSDIYIDVDSDTDIENDNEADYYEDSVLNDENSIESYPADYNDAADDENESDLNSDTDVDSISEDYYLDSYDDTGTDVYGDVLENPDGSEDNTDAESDDITVENEVIFNIFCINNLTEELVAEYEDTEIFTDEEIYFEDIIELDDHYYDRDRQYEARDDVTMEESYRFHSVGVFYHMNEEDYSNNLVPEFYNNSDDFLRTDYESQSITFTDVPDEDVTIVLFVLPNNFETLSVDVIEDDEGIVPVQTQAQLLKPVATGILTDSVPFLCIGCVGLIGLVSKVLNRRREKRWQQQSI